METRIQMELLRAWIGFVVSSAFILATTVLYPSLLTTNAPFWDARVLQGV